VKPGIQVVTPNSKASSGARRAHLTAWACAEHAPGGSTDRTEAFVADVYRHVRDRNVDRHKMRNSAEAYRNFLCTGPVQEIEAKNRYRPRDLQGLKAAPAA
jgi:ABC-type sulfate transport system substrate-binding protein